MNRSGVLLSLIILVLFVAGAAFAFTYHFWILGTLELIGAIAMLLGMLRIAGAWDNPKPWDGEGE